MAFAKKSNHLNRLMKRKSAKCVVLSFCERFHLSAHFLHFLLLPSIQSLPSFITIRWGQQLPAIKILSALLGFASPILDGRTETFWVFLFAATYCSSSTSVGLQKILTETIGTELLLRGIKLICVCMLQCTFGVRGGKCPYINWRLFIANHCLLCQPVATKN